MSAASTAYLRQTEFDQARELLRTSARFGDPESIAARDLLMELERVREAIAACPHEDCTLVDRCDHCSGDGTSRCSECGADVDCHACDGSGESRRPCECISEFCRDFVIEAFGGLRGLPENLERCIYRLPQRRLAA